LEWFPDHLFQKRRALVGEIKTLQMVSPGALAGALRVYGETDERLFVAVFVPGAGPDWGGFSRSGRFQIIYRNSGALIFGKSAAAP
jgi:hypothetical protein